MTAIPQLAEPVLSGRGIVKEFPGVLALDRVHFDLLAGEVHGLIGENGAGKSTLMHCLTGVLQPTAGEILLDGKPVHFANPREALKQRISIVHQELNLIPFLSVAENVFLGRELLNTIGLVDANAQNRRCQELLAQLDPSIDPQAQVNTLRVGQQQIVEIAKSLNSEARAIFMDEPTSAISGAEVEVLFELIDTLRSNGIAIVYVSHKLNELLRITDRITVLRDGRCVDTVTTPDTCQESIVQLMVGRDLGEMYVEYSAESGEEILRIDSLSLRSEAGERLLVDDVSFSVAAGEVLGIFGLMGAGRTELLESIFGVYPRRTCGTVFLRGERCDISSPAAAMQYGIGFVPEDRKEQGLILGMSVENNISLSHIDAIESFGLLNHKLEQRHAEKNVNQLSIKTPTVQQEVRTLSGGNQQKVVLGRVLSKMPQVLLLDEPTRGIDINAKREIYGLIAKWKQGGMAIIVVSSEVPELMGISDRILVMCEGQKTAEYRRGQATEEVLMRAAVPGYQVEATTNA